MLNPSRIYADLLENRCLDSEELLKLENSFRLWSEESRRSDVRLSRKKMMIIFLLIRYTAAKLNEVLSVDLLRDLDCENAVISLGEAEKNSRRRVHMSSSLMHEIRQMLQEIIPANVESFTLRTDEGHVRRKFYERAISCGLPQELGSPQAIRRARAVELMKSNVPLPVVQRILGHSTPNLTVSMVALSDDEIQEVTKHFVERESSRKTSARNTFFGKVKRISSGDVQSLVEVMTLTGDMIASVITNTSLSRLGIKVGSLITAEVKAPWVVVQKSWSDPNCSSENLIRGRIARILSGKVVSEVSIQIHDGTEICALMTAESLQRCSLWESEEVWATFSSFAVILHVD